MIKKIRKYGADVLRRKAAPVEDLTGKTFKVLQDLEETLKKGTGIGLAAPQIGVSLRIFIAFDADKKKLLKLINPQIVEVSGSEIDLEGCLSFPEIYFALKRPKKVTVAGLDAKGKQFFFEAGGLVARCLAHETDHLDGRLIIDYASEGEKKTQHAKLLKLNPLCHSRG